MVQARAQKATVCRKSGHMHDYWDIVNGSYKRTGGSVAQFMITIAKKKSTITAQQYYERINAEIISCLLSRNILLVCVGKAIS